jgi:hypothetical protein
MGYAPEDAVVAPHEMAADMVQSRRLAADEFGSGGIGRLRRIERGAHLEVIEQWCAPQGASFAIDGNP